MLTLRSDRVPYRGREYSSGEVASVSKVTRGSAVEFRTRVPSGQGIWSANWLVDYHRNLLDHCTTWPPEIDVMEVVGQRPGMNLMTHWWGVTPNQRPQISRYSGEDLSTAFHTYRVEWLDDSITWYIDGVERARHTENITEGTMKIALNTAVGGALGGDTICSDCLPQEHLVDYVRVFRRDDGEGAEPSP